MKSNIYAIQDVLTGFKTPMIAANDEQMCRDYKLWASRQDASEDMRLFKIGEFDHETGEIEPMIPECMIGGISHANNE